MGLAWYCVLKDIGRVSGKKMLESGKEVAVLTFGARVPILRAIAKLEQCMEQCMDA